MLVVENLEYIHFHLTFYLLVFQPFLLDLCALFLAKLGLF